jgi:TonB-dependent SusC/RagA subfamily outer membrane receptor
MTMIRRLMMVPLGVAILAGCGGGPRRPAERPTGTGATSVMTSEQLESSQPTRMADLLARIPGIEVQRSGTDFTMRIRGGVRGSFSPCGNSVTEEPLVVIDGMQVSPGRNSVVLGPMNPRDVARVEVLRDAGSTAVYGCAGINGVVLISTKKGR